jgi:hypothetical protein
VLHEAVHRLELRGVSAFGKKFDIAIDGDRSEVTEAPAERVKVPLHAAATLVVGH